MTRSRRVFLLGSAAVLGSAAMAQAQAQDATTGAPTPKPGELPPGSPPAFGTAPPVGPLVSAATFAEAQKLVQVELTESERSQAAGNWRNSIAAIYERRTGPRKVPLDATLAPYSLWNPVLPGHGAVPQRDRFVRSERDPGPLPSTDTAIAF